MYKIVKEDLNRFGQLIHRLDEKQTYRGSYDLVEHEVDKDLIVYIPARKGEVLIEEATLDLRTRLLTLKFTTREFTYRLTEKQYKKLITLQTLKRLDGEGA